MKNFKNLKKYVVMSLFVLAVMSLFVLSVGAAEPVEAETAVETVAPGAEAPVAANNDISGKAMAAALTVGITAAAGAIAMGFAIAKSVDSISRQPEAEGKIRGAMMLGLVFIETAIIYALIVAILIIFVL